MEMNIMFKTNSIKTISATLVSLSIFLGAFLASPVMNASAKVAFEDSPTPAKDYRLEKEEASYIVTTPVTLLPYHVLTNAQFAGFEGQMIKGR
jgi:hypothetical protein